MVKQDNTKASKELKANYECVKCLAILTISKDKDIGKYKCTCGEGVWVLLSTELNNKESKELERLKELQRKGKLWDLIIEEIGKKHIGDIGAKEIVLLSCLGRLVKNKKPFAFNLIVHSESSAGKDHLVDSVLSLFPKNDIEAFGRISKTSLNYFHNKKNDPLFSYDGKILYLEEITGEILNNEVMKVFTSGLNKSLITKDQKAEVLEVKGKPVVIVTTATTKPTPEILNRFTIVKLDESEEQTHRTFTFEEEEYNSAVIHFLNELIPHNVSIPREIRLKLAKVFPKDRVKNRRHFPRFLDIVKTIAVFNQKIRKSVNGEIMATWEDYDQAVSIFRNYRSGVSSIPLKHIDKEIVELLRNEKEPLEVKDITPRISSIQQSQLYTHLRNLVENEVLTTYDIRNSFNHPVKLYSLSEEMHDINPIKLPLSHKISN